MLNIVFSLNVYDAYIYCQLGMRHTIWNWIQKRIEILIQWYTDRSTNHANTY